MEKETPVTEKDEGQATEEPQVIEEIIVEERVPARIKTTRYILHKHKCELCDFEFTTKHKDCPQKGNFGVNLLVYMTMLKYHLRGPLRKIQEFLANQDNFEISPKGIMDAHLRVGEACKSEYEETIQKVRTAAWRYIDETGMSVNGENWWLWIIRTDKGDVLVVIRKSRGKNVLEEILGKDHTGPDVVDGWRAYDHIEIVQRCWSHLIREVDEYMDTSENGAQLSKDIHSMFDQMKEFHEREVPMDERAKRKEKFDREMEALVEGYGGFKELEKPVTYLRRGFGRWFTCLLYPGMEPTNNLGEQGIREHVIIGKIIGCFRSENGSQNYQYIASLLASWRLQGKNMFVELEKLLRRELCLA